MAEVAATIPATVEAPVAVAAAGGRGRGRGKAKGRGKFKGKAKAKKAAPSGEPKAPKEPKVNLRTLVEQEIGDRNIEDVIKEAREKVAQLQEAVAKAQQDELGFEKQLGEGKMAMSEASGKVDAAVHKETLALEKLKEAKKAHIEAQKKLAGTKMACNDDQKALDVLASEGDQQKKEADLLKDKDDAMAAKEAAKKAYNEATLKAKQVAEEIKNKRQALAITDDPEAAAKAKAEAERAAEEEKSRKEAKAFEKNAEHDLKNDLKQLEKARAQRDKDRAKAFKEAAGLGSKKRAIGDGAAASPAKATKIQDVD